MPDTSTHIATSGELLTQFFIGQVWEAETMQPDIKLDVMLGEATAIRQNELKTGRG